MIVHAYAWASGLIQFGTTVPEGACDVCHGAEDLIKPVVTTMADYNGRGQLVIPGTAYDSSQHDNMTATLKWLKWCRARPTRNLT